ncbi:hypothetical protein FK178_02760 [Antarcticibacterium arcticum]|uniref:Uncharacterized protein n=1 Tax=Antarcticibacterium arcticum TaxID=2585771 RepID=A0A5B8YFI5_9FLAO|nr:hypothetical protein [Antarcticibacterium arcticum]QED36700.1 hypothetical protein FK178_02760 [Antarcticibacterium arcticum]
MENVLLEFLKIAPRKEYSDFYREDIYIIPCRVIEFGEEANHNSVWVTIEHLDFNTGETIEKKATCYKNSLRFFRDIELPVENECSIIKMRNGVKFLIFGRFHPDYFVDWDGIYKGKTEDVLIPVFKENYIEFNNWIK